MTTNNFAALFDHTLLKPDALSTDIVKLCDEAVTHHFYAVCVNPAWVTLCKNQLAKSKIQLCTVVGFPLGANTSSTKIFETETALRAGASEIDVVINIGALKEKNLSLVTAELKAIVDVCQGHALVKVIVESGLLSPLELSWAIECVNSSDAEFIKTSTGFASVGATPAAVVQMKREGRPGLKIKASGGIRTADDFRTYLNLGVERIGASKSVEILKELLGSS